MVVLPQHNSGITHISIAHYCEFYNTGKVAIFDCSFEHFQFLYNWPNMKFDKKNWQNNFSTNILLNSSMVLITRKMLSRTKCTIISAAYRPHKSILRKIGGI